MLLAHCSESSLYAIRFVKKKLGGPSVSEHEKLKAEKMDLQLKYEELLAAHRETCKEVLILFFTLKSINYLA